MVWISLLTVLAFATVIGFAMYFSTTDQKEKSRSDDSNDEDQPRDRRSA